MSAKRLSWTVVLIGVVIGIIGSAFFLTRSRSETGLSGTYIARMQQPGKRAYTIRLHLVSSGTALRGDVEYPTGRGAIQDGSVSALKLNFKTSIKDGATSAEQTYTFEGLLRGPEIELVVTAADNSVAKGVARKTD